jgi:hypothetical protein
MGYTPTKPFFMVVQNPEKLPEFHLSLILLNGIEHNIIPRVLFMIIGLYT